MATKTKSGARDVVELAGELRPDYPLEKLIPYENNTKIHAEEQVELLAKLILENGFTDPILVNKKGVIIAGHGRRLAMLKLGYKTIPAFVATNLTPTQERALRISHNKASSSKYDTEKMAFEIRGLSDDGYDISGLGLEGKEIEFMSGDLDVIDESAFADDIVDAVERQNEESQENIDRVDAGEIPVWRALGFKTIAKHREKLVNEFIRRIENETGKQGGEALAHFISQVTETV